MLRSCWDAHVNFVALLFESHTAKLNSPEQQTVWVTPALRTRRWLVSLVIH